MNELQEMKDRLRTEKERENKDALAHVTVDMQRGGEHAINTSPGYYKVSKV